MIRRRGDRWSVSRAWAAPVLGACLGLFIYALFAAVGGSPTANVAAGGAGSGSLLFAFVMVLVIGLAAFLFHAHLPRTEESVEQEYPELRAYIATMRSQGHEDAQIAARLQEAGWPPELVVPHIGRPPEAF